MNLNPNSYNTLLTLQKALSQKSNSEDAVFTKKDLQDLTKSDDKNVSSAANQILQDKNLLNFVDNQFSGTADLNDGKFVLGELNAALISLNPKNAYLADIEAIKTIKNELVTNHGAGPWDKTVWDELKNSKNEAVKTAANRIQNNKQLSNLIDNGFSDKNGLGDGLFQVGELDAAMSSLDPTNPQMQDINALKTILKQVESSPNKEISKADLTTLASTPNDKNPEVRAAARRLLNSPGLLWLTDSDASTAKNDSQIKLQPWELQAMIKDLNPLSPKMLDVSALRTLASAIKSKPDQAITKDDLTTMANDSTINPSVRAAAQRVLNNPQMLQMADNAFSAPGDPLIDSKDKLNDGKIHSGELLAVANALHPLSASSRNLDTLQTIKDVIKANPTEYKNGAMTRDQLIKLQNSNSPDVRQAANRLFNNPDLCEMLDTGLASFKDGEDNKFDIGTIDSAIKTLGPYSKNVQITQALKVITREIESDPKKYPNQQLSPQQIKDVAKNGSPALRQALATLSKSTTLLSKFSSDGLSLQDLDDGLSFYNPVWKPYVYGSIGGVYDYLSKNKDYDLKKIKVDESLLLGIIDKLGNTDNPEVNVLRNQTIRVLKQAPASLNLLNSIIKNGGF